MKQKPYISKKPDSRGIIAYTQEEHGTWEILFEKQIEIVKDRACDAYISGIKALDLQANTIPQLPDICEKLKDLTGWSVQAVPALISFTKFFDLLANRKFPVATFIRFREELAYIQEPDIFHEVFGHCPLLSCQPYADFIEAYGKLALKAGERYHALLARLFWFTIEFGLIQTQKGLRCYGAGILSSPEETIYALESSKPIREPFDLMKVLRTPYRIDILQPVYYIIGSFDALFALTQNDLLSYVDEAKAMGELPPQFPLKDPKHAC